MRSTQELGQLAKEVADSWDLAAGTYFRPLRRGKQEEIEVTDSHPTEQGKTVHVRTVYKTVLERSHHYPIGEARQTLPVERKRPVISIITDPEGNQKVTLYPRNATINEPNPVATVYNGVIKRPESVGFWRRRGIAKAIRRATNPGSLKPVTR